MSKPPLNYSTKIAVTRTIGECHQLLADAGAEMVSTLVTAKKPTGLAFRLYSAGALRDFRLPLDIDGVYELMQTAEYPASWKPAELTSLRSRAQAERVAWRIIKDWLEAQLALIAARMAVLDQVMLPYLQVETGSMYELVQQRGRLAALERS